MRNETHSIFLVIVIIMSVVFVIVLTFYGQAFNINGPVTTGEISNTQSSLQIPPQITTKYCDADDSESDNCNCGNCKRQAPAGKDCICIATQEDQEPGGAVECKNSRGDKGKWCYCTWDCLSENETSRRL